MIIRSAQPADIPTLFPLIEKICEFHRSLDRDRYNFLPNLEPLYRGWLHEILADAHDLCLVAEDDAETASPLVAFTIATLEQEVPVYHLQAYGYIHDLWVESAYRQQGIARQILQQTNEHFRQLGVEQIRLNTVVGNDAALKLYKDCGFRPSTIEMLMTL